MTEGRPVLRLAVERPGLDASHAQAAGLDAANGIALLGDVQCAREAGMLERVARVDKGQAAAR